MGRLVIISGPSCVGKSPLHSALVKFYPELAGNMKTLVLYNSRAPRPAERDGVDYHFRKEDEVLALREREGFSAFEVRGDIQALDHSELALDLAVGDVIFEGNPFVGRALLDVDLPEGVQRISLFVSPLSKEELLFLSAPERNVSLPGLVTDVMRRKLLRRTQKQRGVLSLKDLEEVERRASSAYSELKLAHEFGFVIPNHDGEDSENWSAFYYPLGDARRTLLSVAAWLRGEEPPAAERWEPDMLP